MKGVAGVFSYSKTKGLFAGVSLEGSAIIERRDANEKLYNARYTAQELLEGTVPPPPAAEPLMRVLNSKVFAGVATTSATEDMYNDIPVYDDRHDDVVWEGRTGTGLGEGVQRDRTGASETGGEYYGKPKKANTWGDDVYDRQPSQGVNRSFSTRANPNETFDSLGGRGRSSSGANDDYVYSDRKPSRPTAPKPQFATKPRASTMGADQAVALFTFDADQPGDLGFKKGEVITITKRTENKADWWTGRIGDRTGIFPR